VSGEGEREGRVDGDSGAPGPEIAGGLERYQADPAGFVREVLGCELWSRQAEILEAVRLHPQVTVRSGHGVGKTFVAACAALWWVYCFRPSLVLTTAPTARQVEGLLWGEIARLWRRARGKLSGRRLATRLVVAEDQEALGLSTNEPERFAGWHREHMLAIVDEASGVAEPIYETLLGVLTGSHNHLLLIGNPTRAAGLFYESHRREGWHKVKVSALDTPNFEGVGNREWAVGMQPTDPTPHSLLPTPFPYLVTPAWVAARRADWGEESLSYRVRVLAEFPLSASDGLIELAWVEAAEGREWGIGSREWGPTTDGLPLPSPTPYSPLPTPSVVFGIDVARFGECETVVAVRRGTTLTRLEAWSGRDLMATCGRVVALIREERPAVVVVDPVGLGAGLVDRLRELLRNQELPCFRLVEENGGARATDAAQFANRRAELYHGLRERYRSGEIAHTGSWPRLLGQLTALRYRFSSRGQWLVESKEELRARGTPSPDQADAVALCFAPERRALARPTAIVSERPIIWPLPRL
jgi:phage terminase large subunit